MLSEAELARREKLLHQQVIATFLERVTACRPIEEVNMLEEALLRNYRYFHGEISSSPAAAPPPEEPAAPVDVAPERVQNRNRYLDGGNDNVLTGLAAVSRYLAPDGVGGTIVVELEHNQARQFIAGTSTNPFSAHGEDDDEHGETTLQFFEMRNGFATIRIGHRHYDIAANSVIAAKDKL